VCVGRKAQEDVETNGSHGMSPAKRGRGLSIFRPFDRVTVHSLKAENDSSNEPT
jgi:hypothetical protein